MGTETRTEFKKIGDRGQGRGHKFENRRPGTGTGSESSGTQIPGTETLGTVPGQIMHGHIFTGNNFNYFFLEYFDYIVVIEKGFFTAQPVGSILAIKARFPLRQWQNQTRKNQMAKFSKTGFLGRLQNLKFK